MTAARRTAFILAGVIFILDQATKLIVTLGLGIDHVGAFIELLPIFDLRFVPNVGVSLGLLAAQNDLMRWALVAATAAISAGVVWWMLREDNRHDLLALGLVLGGAAGNIIDRARLGYVIDFADLHFGEWRPFLVFNVADAAITIGVVVLLARALFVREKGTEEAAPVEKKDA